MTDDDQTPAPTMDQRIRGTSASRQRQRAAYKRLFPTIAATEPNTAEQESTNVDDGPDAA